MYPEQQPQRKSSKVHWTISEQCFCEHRACESKKKVQFKICSHTPTCTKALNTVRAALASRLTLPIKNLIQKQLPHWYIPSVVLIKKSHRFIFLFFFNWQAVSSEPSLSRWDETGCPKNLNLEVQLSSLQPVPWRRAMEPCLQPEYLVSVYKYEQGCTTFKPMTLER